MRSTQHILQVGPYPSSPDQIRGGVEASVYGLANALAADSRVTVVAVNGGGGSDAQSAQTTAGDGISVKRLPRRSREALEVLGVPRMLRELRTDWPGVTHVHGTGTVQAAFLAVGRLTHTQVVWTLHGITAVETRNQFRAAPSATKLLKWALYSTIERLQTHLAPRIIVDTNYVKNALGPRCARKTHVIPQGMVQRVRPLDARRGEVPTFLSIGVLTPRKGHHLLIRAFASVRKRCPEAVLHICGALRTQEYICLLEAEIAQHDLADAVKIEVGPSGEHIRALIQQAWAFALHSEEESQGIAICEAMFAGLPIVATNVGGIPDVVTHGREGLLSAFTDVTTFADNLLELARNHERRREMSRAAERRARDFEWPALASRVQKLYQRAEPGKA